MPTNIVRGHLDHHKANTSHSVQGVKDVDSASPGHDNIGAGFLHEALDDVSLSANDPTAETVWAQNSQGVVPVTPVSKTTTKLTIQYTQCTAP